MTIEDVEVDKPQRREVLIRTSAAGLCHSDLHFMDGKYPHPVPVVLGRRLRDAAPAGVTWVEIPGGTHSRLHSEAADVYRNAMQALIQTLSPAGLPPAAKP